ncbi:ornithine cyclodeaminase family protein [Ornithinibacillus halotolerans]|uniref:Delta(1)-pyrroline-2-carboxylate reductase n=1 Tax=Ornithinibacillus halotolerans TaxID=1274357 RepID=A0A916RU79_9BACI|nr:ornithine cyclodeaminase family protein [Ornithinibacillus halotolerans]GGA71326.1 delta(1)-pyrroline-2-carboxylate reductase [Ornithinibacillus halotolerans]
MLFINEKSIKQAVTMKEVIDGIDRAYEIYESNQFQMPLRSQVQDGNNTLVLMPSITNHAIGTKLVTIFPNNQEKTIHGLVILNNKDTGEIEGILDGSFITGFRTGAIGGSAIRHLAKKNASKIAIIGTGVQGLYQAVAACSERPIKEIYLYNRTAEKIPAFKESLKEWIGDDIELIEAKTIEQAIEPVEIIITATTSRSPVLPENKELLRGKLVIGIGSFQPDMREFPETLYQLTNHILVDTMDALDEAGDLIQPLEKNWITNDSIIPMSSYLANPHTVALDENETIVFKSVGMALFDVVVGNIIYKKALEKDIGMELHL